MRKNIRAKKISLAFLLAIFLLSTPLLAIFLLKTSAIIAPITARADSLDEADSEFTISEDDFFLRNNEHILYLGRFFITNGADGFVSAKEAPDSDNEIARLENGNTYYIQNSCLYDGQFWGLIPIYEEHMGALYWVRLDEFLVIYDYIAFEEDHIDELYQYTGSKEELKEAGAMVLWSWPGAESPLRVIDGVNTNSFGIEYVYMDKNGREWGFIRYMYGGGNNWVCLSDPLNPELPAFNPAPAPREWISDTAHTDIAQIKKPPGTFIIALVSILVISSVVIIHIFWKPNNENANKENANKENAEPEESEKTEENND